MKRRGAPSNYSFVSVVNLLDYFLQSLPEVESVKIGMRRGDKFITIDMYGFAGQIREHKVTNHLIDEVDDRVDLAELVRMMTLQFEHGNEDNE